MSRVQVPSLTRGEPCSVALRGHLPGAGSSLFWGAEPPTPPTVRWAPFLVAPASHLRPLGGPRLPPATLSCFRCRRPPLDPRPQPLPPTASPPSASLSIPLLPVGTSPTTPPTAEAFPRRP